MRTRFQQGLDDLRQRLLRMGGLAEQAVDRARQAYVERDLTRCQMVLEGENLINIAEREIDEAAFDMLAMQQPMAVDLRFILAVIKINGDLERIGDQSMSISRRTKEILGVDDVELPVDFAAMGDFATQMIRNALQALLDGDARLADSVREMDDEIDRMNRRAHNDLLKLIEEKPQFTQQAMNGILVAKNLERIADHSSNIATDVIFWIRGADVRHQLSMAMD